MSQHDRDLAEEFPEPLSRDRRRLRGTPIAAGQRFGRLVAIRPTPPRKGSTALHWQFRCDCGTFCVQRVARVVSGRYVSCGCKHREAQEAFTAKAKARSVAAAAQGRGRLSADRDLAEAIYQAFSDERAVDEAISLWRDMPHLHQRERFAALLPLLAQYVITDVLTRRLREAARTGPWGDYEEEAP